MTAPSGWNDGFEDEGRPSRHLWRRFWRSLTGRRPGIVEHCRLVTIELDGEQITMPVLGEQPMSEQGRAAFAEIIAAAKRKFEAEPPRTDLCPDCGFPTGTAAHRRSRKHVGSGK